MFGGLWPRSPLFVRAQALFSRTNRSQITVQARVYATLRNAGAVDSGSASVDPDEVKKFSRISESWWDPHGPFMPLHRMNAIRLNFIRDALLKRKILPVSPKEPAHLPEPIQGIHNIQTITSNDPESVSNENDRDQQSSVPDGLKLELRPFANLTFLDLGCGGGILSESLARMGADVTGIDASAENIQIAQDHYEQCFSHYEEENARIRAAGYEPRALPAGKVRYRHVYAETLAKENRKFDVVCAVEIIEHVNNPEAFVQSCVSLVKSGGHLIFSTMNRTALAYLVTIIGAEYIAGVVPRGTHEFDKYIKPHELAAMVSDSMALVDQKGMFYNPLTSKWSLTSDTSVNYIVCFSKMT